MGERSWAGRLVCAIRGIGRPCLFRKPSICEPATQQLQPQPPTAAQLTHALLALAGANAALAEPRQYCAHSTLDTAQHSWATAVTLLRLHGLEAPSWQLVGGGEGGRHCGPTEQLQREAAGAGPEGHE